MLKIFIIDNYYALSKDLYTGCSWPILFNRNSCQRCLACISSLKSTCKVHKMLSKLITEHYHSACILYHILAQVVSISNNFKHTLKFKWSKITLTVTSLMEKLMKKEKHTFDVNQSISLFLYTFS